MFLVVEIIIYFPIRSDYELLRENIELGFYII